DRPITGAQLLEGQLLPPLDRVVELLHRLTLPAAHDCSRDVAEIARLLRARKDIEDDRFIGAQRAEPAFMGIASLPAPGDDRVARRAAGLKDGSINDRPELF